MRCEVRGVEIRRVVYSVIYAYLVCGRPDMRRVASAYFTILLFATVTLRSLFAFLLFTTFQSTVLTTFRSTILTILGLDSYSVIPQDPHVCNNYHPTFITLINFAILTCLTNVTLLFSDSHYMIFSLR
jgi:hypothetical protein